MGKNVAVFVDVANIFYAAKAAGVDIDYVTLLKSASAGRDLVRAYAYTGLDPDNENQRNFHDFLRRSNYKVVSKDIRKYGDGKVKANLDIELVVDMMKTARNLDIAIVVSGDGDFAPAIRAVQEQGVRVEVISFRGNTSSDLIEVADLFTDIIQLARVEKGSRSGRRVADDDADLSMTEVPDKQTEGTGVGRGRGRGRTPRRAGELEPVSAAARGRGRGRSTPIGAANGAVDGREGALMALPGERLSKAVGSLTEADLAAAEVFTLDAPDGERDPSESTEPGTRPEAEDGEDVTRRRRRRGGRGRGRGRGRDDGLPMDDAAAGERAENDPADLPDADDLAAAAYERELAAAAGVDGDADEDEQDEQDETDDGEQPTSSAAATAVAPRRPQVNPFGSVWDSQLGTAAGRPASSATSSVEDDEDFDEPEIPEYLIAEQRRGAGRPQGGARGGPRGGRSAYQSAMERERFGRGGGGGGINRYPDVSGRSRTEAPRESRPASDGRAGDERPRRDDRPRDAGPRDAGSRPLSARPTGSSEEPWSEVPPELEALLRAQASTAPTARSGTGRAAPVRGSEDAPASAALDGEPAEATPADAALAPAASSRRRTPRSAVPTAEASDTSFAVAPSADDQPVDAPTEAAAPKRRAPRKTATKAVDSAAAATTEAPAPADAATAASTDEAPAPAPKRRAPRKAAATGNQPQADADTDADVVAAPTPKPRAPRKPKAPAPTE